MGRLPSPKRVPEAGEYYHARFRDPGRFDEIRPPEYAATIAAASAQRTVGMGRIADNGDSTVRSGLFSTAVSKSHPRELAEGILEKIEAN